MTADIWSHSFFPLFYLSEFQSHYSLINCFSHYFINSFVYNFPIHSLNGAVTLLFPSLWLILSVILHCFIFPPGVSSPSTSPPMFLEMLKDQVVAYVGCSATFRCILACSSSLAVASITWSVRLMGFYRLLGIYMCII